MADNQSHETEAETKAPGMLDFLWKKKDGDHVESHPKKEDDESFLKTEEHQKIQAQEEKTGLGYKGDEEEPKPAAGVLDFLWKKKVEDPVIKKDDDESFLKRNEEKIINSQEVDTEHGKKGGEDEFLVSQMEKVRVSDYPEQTKDEKEMKHESFLQKLSGSDSLSSSSSDEEDTKTGERKKKKKGLKEEIPISGDEKPYYDYGIKEEVPISEESKPYYEDSEKQMPISDEKKPYYGGSNEVMPENKSFYEGSKKETEVSKEKLHYGASEKEIPEKENFYEESNKEMQILEEKKPDYGGIEEEITEKKPYHDALSSPVYKLQDQTVPVRVETESMPYQGEDKKGFMEKMKDEIPSGGGGHGKLMDEEEPVVSPSGHEKQGMFEKFKNKIPTKLRDKFHGHHDSKPETEQPGV